jgi:glucose/arabinose dehydrogenase
VNDRRFRRPALKIAVAGLAAMLVGACAQVVTHSPAGLASPAGAFESPAPPSFVSPSPAGPRSSAQPSPTSAGDPGRVAVAVQAVVSGLASPVSVTGAGDGSGRLFVLEQAGRIRIVVGGRLLSQPFLDLSSIVSCCGERGLLGLAFHPDFAADGRFYVYYTDTSADFAITIAEYRPSASEPDVADPASGRILLRIPHGQYPNHDGGQLTFGPDRHLYAGTGDGGGAGNPLGTSQDLGSLLGKVLRLDVDHPSGSLLYGTAGNPFVDRSGARPEIWASGLRNPWRFSFDRLTGDLWIGDVGQDRWEEIDHAGAGLGGQDYGWNRMEGFHCYAPASGCDQAGLTLPVAEYGHDAGCAVTGGFVYRGAAYPLLDGVYLYADSCSGRIWGLAAGAAGRQTPLEVAGTGRSIVSFGQDDTGELYVTALPDTLYRLSATTR